MSGTRVVQNETTAENLPAKSTVYIHFLGRGCQVQRRYLATVLITSGSRVAINIVDI